MDKSGVMPLASVREDGIRLITRFPVCVVEVWERMKREKVSGQLIVNFNSGEPQSFEMKEHRKI